MNLNLFLQIYIWSLSIIKKDFPGPSNYFWVRLIEDVHQNLSNEIPDTENIYNDRHKVHLYLSSLKDLRFLLWDSYNDKLIFNRKRSDISWKFTEDQKRIGDILFGKYHSFK